MSVLKPKLFAFIHILKERVNLTNLYTKTLLKWNVSSKHKFKLNTHKKCWMSSLFLSLPLVYITFSLSIYIKLIPVCYPMRHKREWQTKFTLGIAAWIEHKINRLTA